MRKYCQQSAAMHSVIASLEAHLEPLKRQVRVCDTFSQSMIFLELLPVVDMVIDILAHLWSVSLVQWWANAFQAEIST